MEEKKKYTLELKQTIKGIWHIGSLKINVNNFEEFNSLVDEIVPKLEWKIEELNNKSTPSKKSPKKKEEIILTPEEEKLFEHLREVRLELASKEGYPPYIIFHDSALKQMAKEKPQSHQSMEKLIGEKKFDKYGKIFVKEIFQFS